MGLLDIFRRKRPEDEFYGPPPGMPMGMPPPAYGPPPPGMPPTAAVREMRIPSPEMLERMEMAGAPPPGIPLGMPPPPPPPPAYPMPAPAPRPEPRRLLTEDIEAIAESIVASRWKTLTKDFNALMSWKSKTENNINKLNDKIKDIGSKIDGLEKELLAKIEEYSKGMSDVSAEIRAIQKVFRATMPEFTSRVKELSALVEKVKAKRPTKTKRRKKRK